MNATSPPKTACLYLRTARVKQTRYDDRLAQQHAVCLAVASALGARVTKHYVDYGVSGRVEQRPALQRMLGALTRVRTDYVVMASHDRLSRSLPLTLSLVKQITRTGARIVTRDAWPQAR